MSLFLALSACQTSSPLPAGDAGRARSVLIESDHDRDGMTDAAEAAIGTDPERPDTDGDGVSDTAEVRVLGTDPVDDGRFCDAPWTPVSYDEGNQIERPSLGDIDGDGDADLVMTDRGSHETLLYEHLGLGSGAFGPPRVILTPAPDTGAHASLGDLDGDGLSDILLAANPDYDDIFTLTWHRNLGGGAFDPLGAVLDAREDIHEVVAVDVDQDGDLDPFYLGEFYDWSLWIPNHGGGEFGDPEFLAIGWDLALFDVDGDGLRDAFGLGNTQQSVSWFRNLGEGQFRDDRQVWLPHQMEVQATGDLDGDGDEDLVWRGLSRDEWDNLAWTENLGPGELGPLQPLVPEGWKVRSTSAADLDDDGDIDLVLQAKEHLAWAVNDGTGRFVGLHLIAPADDPVIVVDLDGDGLLDLIILDSFGFDVYANPLGVGLGDQDGDGMSDTTERCVSGTDPAVRDSDNGGVDDRAELWRFTPTDPGSSSDDAPPADLDGDGLDEGEEVTHGTSAFSVDTDGDALGDGQEVVLGLDPGSPDTDGDGLDDGAEQAWGTNPAEADTDEDGLDDGAELAAGTDPRVPDTDGDGAGDGREVEIGTDPLGADPDLDGDGLVDADEAARGTSRFLADTDGDGLADGQEVALGTDPRRTDTDADGVADKAEIVVTATDPRVDESTCELDWERACYQDARAPLRAKAITAGDLDSDGDPDVAMVDTAQGVRFFENVDGAFAPVGFHNETDVEFIATADLDGDGAPDLLTLRRAYPASWYRNQGGFQFGPRRDLGSVTAQRVDAADLTGDALPEVVVIDDGQVRWLENLGGQFGAPVAVCADCADFAALDLDVDGLSDLVLLERSDNVIVHRALGGGLFGAPQWLGMVASADHVHPGDIDADGAPDLLVLSGSDLLWMPAGGPFDVFRGIPLAIEGDLAAVSVGDLDADGLHDVLTSELTVGLSRGRNATSWYRAQGDGTYPFHAQVTSDRPFRLVAVDLDADGDSDVLHADGWSGACIQLNRKADDRDADGLRTESETCAVGTDPDLPDTDGGGTQDGVELDNLTDPLDRTDGG